MAQLLLIRGARQLVTLRGPDGLRRGAALGDLAIIEDGSLLIRDGVIASVGSTRRLDNLKEARSAPEIDINGAIVLPGFVDPSLEFSSLLDNAPDARRARPSSERHNELLALLRACLQHGTLNAQFKAVSEAPGVRPEIWLLRQLAIIGNHPIGTRRAWRVAHQVEAADMAALIGGTLELLVRRKLLHTLEVCRGAEAALDSLARLSLRAPPRLGLYWAGGSAAELQTLLQSLQPSVIHCPAEVSSEESALLAAAPAPVVIAPGPDILTPAPRRTARDLAHCGAAIALSAGFHARHSPNFNMQMAIALAVARLGLTTEQAIAAATINAAHALGQGRLIGSIEAGKRADLIILNLPDYRELPRRFGINHVGMVIREGKVALNRTGWKVTAA